MTKADWVEWRNSVWQSKALRATGRRGAIVQARYLKFSAVSAVTSRLNSEEDSSLSCCSSSLFFSSISFLASFKVIIHTTVNSVSALYHYLRPITLSVIITLFQILYYSFFCKRTYTFYTQFCPSQFLCIWFNFSSTQDIEKTAERCEQSVYARRPGFRAETSY